MAKRALTTYTKFPNQVYVQIKYFMCDWSIFTAFVLNRFWKRVSHQIMVFVCLLDMEHRWTKNAFWEVNNKKWCKWCNIVSRSLSNNTYGPPVLTIDTKYPKQHTICAKDGLEMWFPPNDEIRKYLIDMQQGSTKNAFWDMNNTKWRKWCSLFHLSYLITLMVYLRSQQTPDVQIKYFMFGWSIFTLFVLNRAWKRDSLQIIIFVYICSTLNVVEL
jgi:hypothetical protein